METPSIEQNAKKVVALIISAIYKGIEQATIISNIAFKASQGGMVCNNTSLINAKENIINNKDYNDIVKSVRLDNPIKLTIDNKEISEILKKEIER